VKDCAYYQELISRLIDREITPEEGEELAAHARECEECRAVYTAFVALSEQLSGDLVEPPEELHENVMAEIRRAELWKQNRKPKNRLRRWAAIAACAVLAVGVGALTLPRLLHTGSATAAAKNEAASVAEAPMMAVPAAGAASYDSAAPAEEAYDMAPPIAVSDSFAAPASETTKSEQEMISEAVARSEEQETEAPVVDVTGQGRGKNISALLVGTPGDLPANQTPDRRFLLRFDVDGVSSQVLISVYGEKVFYISLSGEESDMMLADCSWSTLRAAIGN
jgi:anti-sigma factor RsiW